MRQRALLIICLAFGCLSCDSRASEARVAQDGARIGAAASLQLSSASAESR